MNAAEQNRLARILAMLSSPHDGERAAAGYLATAFIAKHGLVWGHLASLACPAREAAPDAAVRPEQRRHPHPAWQGYCRRRPATRGDMLNCLS